MRTWIGEHPDTRMNSRIRVSTDPPDRQMPVSAASAITFFVCFFPGFLGGSILSVSIRVHPVRQAKLGCF
jgi:hypothetical protein